ncbi:MAG: protoporphyrinogen oxidase [Gammaproteobacteria bacterium]|nr:MAG: protoporphyrinogen oxidase [Gammaproteobacteria bacterium]
MTKPPPAVLFVYSSTDGHTAKICHFIGEHIASSGYESRFLPIDEVSEADIALCDKIVLAARIRYGKHHKMVYRFVKRYLPLIQNKPNAYFSVGLVARKPDKNRPETNPSTAEFLRTVVWQPSLADAFAGKYAYDHYGLGLRLIMGQVFRISEGKPAPRENVEFTDWDRVRAFADALVKLEK